MRKILPLLFLFPYLLIAQSGDNRLTKQWNFSLGAAGPNRTAAAISLADQYFKTGSSSSVATPFFLASATYGLSDNFEAGPFIGYFSGKSDLVTAVDIISNILGTENSVGTANYSVFSVGVKLKLHRPIFVQIDKLDTYVATYLGYNFVNDDISISSTNETIDIAGVKINLGELANRAASNINYPEITYEVSAGAKYPISDNFSIYGEAGYGRFIVNLGLVYTLDATDRR